MGPLRICMFVSNGCKIHMFFLNKAGLLTQKLANVEPTRIFYLSLGPFDKVFSSDVS